VIFFVPPGTIFNIEIGSVDVQHAALSLMQDLLYKPKFYYEAL
jgi:hypothetical protein